MVSQSLAWGHLFGLVRASIPAFPHAPSADTPAFMAVLDPPRSDAGGHPSPNHIRSDPFVAVTVCPGGCWR